MVHIAQGDSTLQACRDHLARQSGVSVTISKCASSRFAGEIFRVELATNPRIRLLGILRRQGGLIKGEIHHLALGAEMLLRQIPGISHKAILLMAPWISATIADLLQEKGIFYVDAVGNMDISVARPRMVLKIKGRRPADRPKADPGRLIEPSGLKVIHLLLTDAESLTLPYRTLGPRAGVSFASVGFVFRELVRDGHLTANRKRLEKIPALIDHFVRGYALKLRPEIYLGTFRHRAKDFDTLNSQVRERLANAGGQWALTGCAAAGILTRHLKTDHMTVLVDETSEAALRNEPMVADTREGNITLLRLFAPSAIARQDANYPAPTATPLLVYAELLHDGRARELEAAALIKPMIFQS